MGIRDVSNDARLVEEFILELEIAGRSRHTVEGYRRWLERARGFLAAEGASFLSATPHHVRGWLASLNGAAPATRALAYAVLHRFYAWLEAQGEVARSPVRQVAPPRLPDRLVPALGEDEIRRILACPLLDPRRRMGARNRAIFLTMLDTGLRRFELLSMRLDPAGRYELVRVRGKGDRERLVALSPSTRRAILRYIRLWRLGGEGPLWRSRTGRALDHHGLNDLFQAISEATGVHVWPHLLRHTWATAMRDAGADMETVQTLGGWRSPSMLLHYTRSRQTQRALEAHRRFSPVERLGLS